MFYILSFTFSWSLLKYVIFKSLLHALAVLGYLPKLKRGIGLAFSTDFQYTFSLKMFLFKKPIK